MAKVVFTTHLERYITCPTSDVPGGTVREVLDSVFAENPPLRGYIVDEEGALRKHVSVFVDNAPINDRVRLADPVNPDSEIYVLQALSGGSR